MADTDPTIPLSPKPEQQPVPAPIAPTPEAAPRPAIHTYQDDLARAMDTTDATVVSEMLSDARARESAVHAEAKSERERKWFSIASLILIALALAAIAYGGYYFTHLTVPVEHALTVGVFQNADPVVTSTTDIRSVVSTAVARTDLQADKPVLIPLVYDATALAPLTPKDFFTFLESGATEPYVSTIGIARLGIMNTDTDNVPFVIVSVADSEVATKEFLIAEPDILSMYYKALNIPISAHITEVGKGFGSEYMYNLPVRTLRAGDAGDITIFYGYANDHTIVITTKPAVFKAIYDSIIRQH